MNGNNVTLIQSVGGGCSGRGWFFTHSLISFVCYSFSFSVYAVYVTALLRHRRTILKCSFYTICISLSIADMWGIVHKLWRLLPNIFAVEGIYRALGQPLTVFLRAQFIYTSAASMLGNVFLTLNLFTAVVYPMQLNRFWSARNLRLALAVQWITPLLLVMVLILPFNWDFRMEYQLGKTLYSSFAASDLFLSIWLGGWALVQILISVLFCALYVAMIRSLWRHFKIRRRFSSHSEAQSKPSEVSMCAKRAAQRVRASRVSNGSNGRLASTNTNGVSSRLPSISIKDERGNVLFRDRETLSDDVFSTVSTTLVVEKRPRVHSLTRILDEAKREGNYGFGDMQRSRLGSFTKILEDKRDSISLILEKVQTKRRELLDKIEFRLAVAGLLMSFLQMLVGVHAVCSLLNVYANDFVQEIAHGLVHGLYLQANPYIMLFMSATVRHCFVSVLKCRTHA